MRSLRGLRGVAVASVAATLGSSSACSSPTRYAPAAIELHFANAKGLLDVTEVTLRVFDAAGDGSVTCNGPLLSGPAPSTSVKSLSLTQNGPGCSGGKWCGSLSVEQNVDRELTWYVEGSTGGGNPAFTGCTQAAVTQDPQQITLTVQQYIVGHLCSDGVLSPPWTCVGAADDACDGACQTKEEVLSNGTLADGYARGNVGHKTAISTRFLDDGRFYATWADAVGSGGGDDPGEITVRRMTATLQTDATAVLQREIRLQIANNFSTNAQKKRSGPADYPSLVQVESPNLLFVFQREPAGDTAWSIWASVQSKNLTSSTSDVKISGTASATAPHVAAASNGDALIVFLESSTLKSVLRKSGGALSPAQTLAPTGVVGVPRVAWVGGDFVVVWSDADDVQMRRVAADGTAKGAASVVNASRKAGKQDQPDIAAFDTGEFLVAFRDGAGDVGADIRVQKFDKTGAATGSEIGAVTNDLVKAGDQATPAVARGTNSKGQRFYAVVWIDPSAPQIQGRFVSADGDGYLGNSVNGRTDEFSIGLAPAPRSWPSVAVGGQAPGFVAVTWSDDSPGDPAGADDRVRLRRLPLPAEF
jgi:hypothetical protein